MRNLILLLVCTMALTGCYDSEDRAQEHYIRALDLFSEGDSARAMLELRNVLANDGQHENGRRLYADTLLEQNDIEGAYAQYLRLIEQYPNTVDVRRLLAEIALDLGDRTEFERHAMAVLDLAPDDPAHKALGVMMAYNNADARNDAAAAAAAVEQAQQLLADTPNLDTALRIMVNWAASGPEPESALPYIENLLERHPDSQSLMMAQLRALDASGREEDVGAALRAMYDRYPEIQQFSDMLLSWYLSRDNVDAAVAFLREWAGSDDAELERHAAVVRLLQQTKGARAALRELDRLADANDGTDLGLRYAAQAAGRRFELGADRRTETMEQIVATMEDTSLRNDAQIVLVKMYRALGEADLAATMTDGILEADPYHVEALVTRALDQIQEGNFSDAVNNLRTALDQSPRNTSALLILANAQQRLGNIALAEQRFAQAVEVSGGAPQAAMAFAQFQISRNNFSAAQRVLNESISLVGVDIEVAAMLGRIHLQTNDTDGAHRLLEQLVASENPDANGLIRNMQANILFNENRIEDSLNFLRNSLDEDGDGTDDLGTELQMLRIQLLSSRFDEARVQLGTLRQRFPDSTALRVIEANLLSLEGRVDEAITLFRAILEEDPTQLIVIQRLYTLLQQTNQLEAATDLLLVSLELQPDARPLVLLRALELEVNGDVDAALVSYEILYEDDPNDLVVVNNYASLLAYYTDDEASLQLADKISAPLNGTNIPAFLDTLGYISMRQGATNDAISNFEAAVRILPDHPTLAFNLANAYSQSGRTTDALSQLERGFRLADGMENVPKIEDARELYDRLTEMGQ